MIVLGHGGVMEEIYKFLGYFNEEGHLFNFMHKDRIHEDGSVKNVCRKWVDK